MFARATAPPSVSLSRRWAASKKKKEEEEKRKKKEKEEEEKRKEKEKEEEERRKKKEKEEEEKRRKKAEEEKAEKVMQRALSVSLHALCISSRVLCPVLRVLCLCYASALLFPGKQDGTAAGTPAAAREAGSDPRGHLGVTWGVYLCAGKPPLADIILSNPPDLTRCDSVIGLVIAAMSGNIRYRGTASGHLYIGISGINRVLSS